MQVAALVCAVVLILVIPTNVVLGAALWIVLTNVVLLAVALLVALVMQWVIDSHATVQTTNAKPRVPMPPR